MNEKCERCKKPIGRSAVAQESLGDLLYYHMECFEGKIPSGFVFMQKVRGAVKT